MEYFTLLCKVYSGITSSHRISLNVAVLVKHAYGKQYVSYYITICLEKWGSCSPKDPAYA